MAKIALFGDSYISHLERFCSGDLKIPGDVRFFGVGGMNFENYSDILKEVKIFEPDAVFMNLCGNSITSTSKPRELSDEVIKIVNELKQTGVKKVYVAQITERGKFKDKALKKKSFDGQRKKINKLLREMYEKDFIVLHDIKYHRDYKTDLVHFNDRGNQKFFYIIRRVLLSFRNI